MLNKIRNKLASKDGRVILENFLSLSALQVVGIALPLITLPYVLRVIGFEYYGVIVMSASLVAYFQSLTDFSFRITATRDVAIFKDNQKKLNLIYSKVLSVKFVFLIFSYLIIAFLVALVPQFNEYKIIYFSSSLMLFGYAIFPEWFFQGIEKMRYITFLNVGVKLFFTIMIFVFIREKDDFWMYPLLQSSGFIGAGLIGQYILIRKYKLKLSFLPLQKIIRVIKENVPVFINQFIPTLYNNSSVFLLGLLSSNMIVGIYNAILVVVNLLVTILEILSRVFFPFLNRRKDKFPQYLRLSLSVSIALICLLLFGNEIVFWYLNVTYDKALDVLIILLVCVLGYTFYNIFGTNYFLVHRMDKLVMWNTIFASMIGVIMVYPLVKSFGIVGAAINLSICRLLMGGGLLFKYLKFRRSGII